MATINVLLFFALAAITIVSTAGNLLKLINKRDIPVQPSKMWDDGAVKEITLDTVRELKRNLFDNPLPANSGYQIQDLVNLPRIEEKIINTKLNAEGNTLKTVYQNVPLLRNGNKVLTYAKGVPIDKLIQTINNLKSRYVMIHPNGILEEANDIISLIKNTGKIIHVDNLIEQINNLQSRYVMIHPNGMLEEANDIKSLLKNPTDSDITREDIAEQSVETIKNDEDRYASREDIYEDDHNFDSNPTESTEH